jgi:hypothetical protein
MNPSEINKRIAIYRATHSPHDWDWNGGDPSNYHGDLNAMHEAESMLSDVISIKSYCHHLTSQAEPEHATEHLVRCSAADKAEAFLRTIGQWEDDK